VSVGPWGCEKETKAEDTAQRDLCLRKALGQDLESKPVRTERVDLKSVAWQGWRRNLRGETASFKAKIFIALMQFLTKR